MAITKKDALHPFGSPGGVPASGDRESSRRQGASLGAVGAGKAALYAGFNTIAAAVACFGTLIVCRRCALAGAAIVQCKCKYSGHRHDVQTIRTTVERPCSRSNRK